MSEVVEVSPVSAQSTWADRARAAGIHLGLSAVVAALCAAAVFFVWYPFPYREISGGRDLFMLVVAVDVVMGPFLTFAVFNKAKPMRDLKRDLAIIVALQLAALVYGIYSVALARPVHLVFEVDRLKVVHAVEVEAASRHQAPKPLDAEPWLGPTLISAREPRTVEERNDAMFKGAAGLDVSARPKFWEPYAQARPRIAAKAQRISALKERFPGATAQIDAAVQQSGKPADQLLWLPLVSRRVAWTALLDAQTLEPVHFFALDPF